MAFSLAELNGVVGKGLTFMEHIFYRYLSSHGFETLKNCWFMASRPSKYWGNWSSTAASDPFECKPQMVIDGRSLLLEGVKVDHAAFADNFNAAFNDPQTMDSMVRILCLSDPLRHSSTDLYMWYRYGKKFSGVRIGIKLSLDEEGVCNMLRRFRGEYVKYGRLQNNISTSDITTQDDLSERCFNVIFKKSTRFRLESEFRLLAGSKYCKSTRGLDFIPLDNDMIVSVDIGYRMPDAAKMKLLRHCKRNFNLDFIKEARCAGRTVEYKELYNRRCN